MPAIGRPPQPLRSPGLGIAAAFVLLYFVLQFACSVLVGVGMGVITAVRDKRDNPLLTAAVIGDHARQLMAHPDARSVMVILTLLGAGLPMLFLLRRRWPDLWRSARPPGFGLVLPGQRSFFVLALGIGLAAPVLGSWISQWLAHGHPVPQAIRQLGSQTSPPLRLLMVLAVTTLGPLVEELLFRGLLLSALLQRLRVGWAMLVSALLFALVHLPGLEWHVYALPALTLLALALAWLRLQAGSLWPAVLAHGINNLLAVAVWFVAVKPPG